MLRSLHTFFSDCHIEKPWPVNRSVLGVKEQSQGVIFFKNIGENEMDELGQNRDNLNHGNYCNP